MQGKRIRGIVYNWRPCADSDKDGEEFDTYYVGKNGVTEIIDQRMNENCYNVLFENGDRVDIFNPNKVYWIHGKKN